MPKRNDDPDGSETYPPEPLWKTLKRQDYNTREKNPEGSDEPKPKGR